MILKRLRLNSVQKTFNRLLKEVKYQYTNDKIKTIGILIHHDEFRSYDQLECVFKSLGFTHNQFTVLSFIDEEETTVNSWDNTFKQEDFGWKGKILNPEVETFIANRFDALVSYYNGNHLELNMVALLSKAKFKIGLNNHHPELYQLFISLDVKYVDIFHSELEKYLRTLNKL